MVGVVFSLGERSSMLSLGKCITVFSAPNYCDTMGNKGAFITIRGDDVTPKFTSYEAVPHPAVRPMMYANQLSMFGLM